MSTRSNTTREGSVPKTDPKWYPTTQGLNRWINKMADRSDLTVRVLRHTSGAPARFVPTEAEIDINEGLIAAIDPTIAGSPEFVCKHRAIAGACVHEACHARCSTLIDLNKIARRYGRRHTTVFQMLEEGRCETQSWPHLSGVEKLALQSMVLEIVLRDMEDENGETQAIDMRGVVRLAGLLLARINTGIVDISAPMGGRMNDALIEALGAEYATLYDLAVRFSHITVGYWDHGEDELHAIVRKWIEVEDRIIPPDEGGDGGDEGGEPGEEGGDPGGEGKGKGKSEEKSEDESKSDSGEGDESSKGEGDEQGEDTTPGSDDEGTVGDGSRDIAETDPASEAALGDYASGNVDSGTFADIFDAVREAAEEAEKVSGSRLREEVVAIHRANAGSHADRRRKNAEAMKRWRR